MAHVLSLLLIAVAISLDSFSTGLAYGLRKMRIPLMSLITIALCSAFTLGIAMLFGQMIQQFFSQETANRIGGFILITIGCWIIYQFIRAGKDQSMIQEKLLLNWEIKSLGVVIHILKKPTRADFDRSGTITGLEAVLLGAALSLDAFGVGIGAAMLGYSPLLLASLTALIGFIFLSSGLLVGRIFAHITVIQRLAFMPGVLLILIGILKM